MTIFASPASAVPVSAKAQVATFDILVTDGFVLTEFAAIVDVLRAANRIRGYVPFDWTVRSVKGGKVESGAGAFVDTLPVSERPDADYLLVLGNADPKCAELSYGPLINLYTFRKIQVFLFAEAASRYICENPDKSSDLTTHWENGAVLQENQSMSDTSYTLASRDGLIVSCAGMGATIDVVLAIVGRYMSQAAVLNIADIHLHHKIRDFGTLQPFDRRSSPTTGDRGLDRCLDLMQAHTEDPMQISQLVSELGISGRSLERKFKEHLKTTPHKFYRELRLNKANNLLLNTDMTIQEIGLACGFASGFTSFFKERFGVTPTFRRRQNRRSR